MSFTQEPGLGGVEQNADAVFIGQDPGKVGNRQSALPNNYFRDLFKGHILIPVTLCSAATAQACLRANPRREASAKCRKRCRV